MFCCWLDVFIPRTSTYFRPQFIRILPEINLRVCIVLRFFRIYIGFSVCPLTFISQLCLVDGDAIRFLEHEQIFHLHWAALRINRPPTRTWKAISPQRSVAIIVSPSDAHTAHTSEIIIQSLFDWCSVLLAPCVQHTSNVDLMPTRNSTIRWAKEIETAGKPDETPLFS